MNSIILEILKNGFSLELNYRDNKIVYRLEGFYKSSGVNLTIESDTTLLATARYNTTRVINSFDDLVYFNHEWWTNSKNRFDGWSNPDSDWAEHMVRLGLIEKTVKTITEYK